MVLCDTHIHLLAPDWDLPISERLPRLAQSGVGLQVQPGVRAADWEDLIALAQQHPGVYAAPGLHPLYAADWNTELEARLGRLCRLPEVVAIGEIGLDGVIGVAEQLQETAFRAQLELAVAVGLPVLIHCRKQTAQVLKLLQQSGVSRVGGIWHGFSGSLETAEQAVGQGLLIGVGPVLLRENARKLPEVVQSLPAEAMVLETDAPDMATAPGALLEVAAKLAELRGWSLAETAATTTANARRLLKLQDTY
jgi:TatD DNase family protein